MLIENQYCEIGIRSKDDFKPEKLDHIFMDAMNSILFIFVNKV